MTAKTPHPIPDDQLRVTYPEGGTHLLLQWYTDDDRGHLIVAKTEQALTATARRVFEEHPDARIDAYLEVDIIGPSEHMMATTVKERREDRIRNFQREIACDMRSAVEAGRSLPPQFSRCVSYDPIDFQGNDEWAIRCHYACKNCMEGIILVNTTPEKFYTIYYMDWLTEHPNTNLKVGSKNGVVSRAKPASSSDALWCVRPRFGPHSDGLVFAKVKDEPDTSSGNGALSHSHLDGYTLFFFRDSRDLDHTSLQATLDDIKSKDITSHTVNEERRVAELERQKQEEIDATLKFFQERS